MLQTLLQSKIEKGQQGKETKITDNGIKSEHRAWTGQGGSFVSWIGGLGSRRGPGAWNRCHRTKSVPSACASPPRSFKEAKNPKPLATPSFFIPSSQKEEAVEPSAATVHPKFQRTQNSPPVGLCKENNRKRMKLN